jgi:MOSC domain-containing protein
LQVSAIHIYPIKSCRGLAVASATLEARGLAGDRRYMLVDANGRFLTQRQHPRLALVGIEAVDGGYRVTAPEQPALALPPALGSGTVATVTIWRDRVEALLADESVNLWFTRYLGFACGLVYMRDDQHRPVSNPAAEFDDEVSFADGAPLLLLTTASLAELNGRLARPVAMQRFRPNLVVDGAAPFAEDQWRTIAIGTTELTVAWPCARCALPNVDPRTGERDPQGEPLATLMTYRRTGAKVLFGQNLIPRVFGTLRVGDALRVQEKATS